jgi:hypothetical protein
VTAFHAAFAKALTGDLECLWPHLEPSDRTLGALAVYRNTTIKGRIDALEANYPTVLQMVGEDWFRAAAAAFVTEQPGDTPVLVDYGAGFPDWLAGFEPARDMTYLARPGLDPSSSGQGRSAVRGALGRRARPGPGGRDGQPAPVGSVVLVRVDRALALAGASLSVPGRVS